MPAWPATVLCCMHTSAFGTDVLLHTTPVGELPEAKVAVTSKATEAWPAALQKGVMPMSMAITSSGRQTVLTGRRSTRRLSQAGGVAGSVRNGERVADGAGRASGVAHLPSRHCAGHHIAMDVGCANGARRG